jgi:hypothetical protein
LGEAPLALGKNSLFTAFKLCLWGDIADRTMKTCGIVVLDITTGDAPRIG